MFNKSLHKKSKFNLRVKKFIFIKITRNIWNQKTNTYLFYFKDDKYIFLFCRFNKTYRLLSFIRDLRHILQHCYMFAMLKRSMVFPEGNSFYCYESWKNYVLTLKINIFIKHMIPFKKLFILCYFLFKNSNEDS